MAHDSLTLSPDEVETFKRRLAAQRKELLAQMAEFRGEVPVGEPENQDDGAILEEREEAIGELATARKELDRVDVALARIADGTYGLSAVSGKPIPRARLEALPTAITLVDESPPKL